MDKSNDDAKQDDADGSPQESAALNKLNHRRGRSVKTNRPVPEELQPPRLTSQKLLVNMFTAEL